MNFIDTQVTIKKRDNVNCLLQLLLHKVYINMLLNVLWMFILKYWNKHTVQENLIYIYVTTSLPRCEIYCITKAVYSDWWIIFINDRWNESFLRFGWGFYKQRCWSTDWNTERIAIKFNRWSWVFKQKCQLMLVFEINPSWRRWVPCVLIDLKYIFLLWEQFITWHISYMYYLFLQWQIGPMEFIDNACHNIRDIFKYIIYYIMTCVINELHWAYL